MTPDIIINGKALYTTKGAAREYGRIGCNFYTGCPHECTYCYLKRGAPSKQLGGNKVRLKACFKNEQHAADILRQEMDKWIEPCRKYGIFLSFSTDPLIDKTRGLTSVAITECVVREIPVWVLTKCSTFIYDECDFMAWLEAINPIFRGSIHFGFTLTGHDEMEPRANTNQDRIMAMLRMHLMGFSTFASIEPVITWKAAERMVCESLSCCDHYKLGLRSGVKYNVADSGAAIERIVRTVEAHGKTIYLKESTRRLLQQYFQPGAYEAFLSHTVDMDGKHIKHDYAIAY